MARPKADEAARRSVAVAVKFTAAERARLLEEADRLRLSSLSELIRQRALSGRVVVEQRAELAALDRVELHRIGVNLNQIAKHLHTHGHHIAELAEIEDEARELLARLNRLLIAGAEDAR